MDKERFSLLLLEPNEIYFEDFAVDLLPEKIEVLAGENDENNQFRNRRSVSISSGEDEITGRLKLCSKSLVFDPKSVKLPLVKLRYTDVERILESSETNLKKENCLIIRCSQYIEMLENNVLTPYITKKESRHFIFLFHYAKVNDFALQICQQLHRASSLHASEQNVMIGTIIQSLHNRIKFNPLWLDNIYEEKLYDCQVEKINPLVLNPGRLLLTDTFIYFQPYNNLQARPVVKIKLKNIISLNERRFLLRRTGLSIKWINNSDSDNEDQIYISFRSNIEREKFCSLVKKQDCVNLKNVTPENMTLKWRNRLISNYDYLLYLNSIADRSFEDLTQYPVFPWILNDYVSEELNLTNEKIYRDLSKPVGALNPERLARLKERCKEMGDPKYLYGSHYSTPGFVLFYLARKYPNLMLCLQNGRFDHPDRMFNSILDTYNNCLTNMSDFKELIPEFYDTSQEGSFLLNQYKVNFGVRSDGSLVNHVELPPWANNSPNKFVKILRDALESEYVSLNLHKWIDLIFGCKQRGEEAEKADNLFYHLCYEGSVDLDEIKDSNARHALEVQISEFGQIPKQLFDKPHVCRKMCSFEELESPIKSNELFHDLEEKLSYTAHKDEISSLLIDGDNIVSSGKDGVLKFYTITQQKQARNVSINSQPLSSCARIPNSNTFVIGSWDNTIFLYNCNFGKVTDVIPAHDDAVSCLNLIEELGILISGSWDCSIKLWKGFNDIETKTFQLSKAMIGYIPLEEKVTSLTYKRESTTDSILQIVAGTERGEVFMWELNINTQQKSYLEDIDGINNAKLLVKHSKEINCIEFDKTLMKFASCSSDGLLYIIDINTEMVLLKYESHTSLTTLTWCNENDFLFVGDYEGTLAVWDLTRGQRILSKKVFTDSISCVKYSDTHKLIIIAGKDRANYKVKCWSNLKN